MYAYDMGNAFGLICNSHSVIGIITENVIWYKLRMLNFSQRKFPVYDHELHITVCLGTYNPERY